MGVGDAYNLQRFLGLVFNIFVIVRVSKYDFQLTRLQNN